MAAGNKTGHGWIGVNEKESTRRNGKKKQELNPAEKRRAVQLVICLILFAVVFAGRGISIGTVGEIGSTLAEVIDTNTDFRAAFARVGQSVSEGEPVKETFGVIWSGVFGVSDNKKQDTSPQSDQSDPAQAGDTNEGAETAKAGETGAEAQTAVPETAEQKPNEADTGANAESTPATVPSGDSTSTKNVEEGEKAQTSAPLLDETVTPVMGVLTSGFGYRTHPVDGEWKYHYGVDVKAAEGTDILAFSNGVVDYIGESDAYGLYLQLKHADGVTSFYAHCSDICVKTGQTVSVKQKIAEVGHTGDTTGPHLHFEIRKNGEYLDPVLYIETEKS